MSRQNWNQTELLAAFNLYCQTPFGKLHARNPDVIDLATRILRTPNAVAMKLVNYASLDPVQQARGIVGLKNVGAADRALMQRFHENAESVILESESAKDEISAQTQTATESEILVSPTGPTEKTQTVRVRVVQSFFRNAVLSSYNFQCAFCGLGLIELLNVSHIIPWKASESQRANPSNGLALCALHDRAFDRGLMSLDAKLGVLLSQRLLSHCDTDFAKTGFIALEGQTINLPSRFAPDVEAVNYHRQFIFQTK